RTATGSGSDWRGRSGPWCPLFIHNPIGRHDLSGSLPNCVTPGLLACVAVAGPDAASEHGFVIARGRESYSCPARSAAAAANGPTTSDISVSAQRIVNGVPNGTGPTTAAFEADTPKISTGTASGRISTGRRRPP